MKSKICHSQKCPPLAKGGERGFLKSEEIADIPLLYYKTKEEIDAYRRKPVKQKLQWLEAQMEFFHKAMPAKAKRIREKFRQGGIQ